MLNEFIKPTVKHVVQLNFIHHEHGLSWFKYQINDLNGNVMYWFSYSNSMFFGLSDVKKIVNAIKTDKKFTFISEELVNF